MPELDRTDGSDVGSSGESDPWVANPYRCNLERFESFKTELQRLLEQLVEKRGRYLLLSIGGGPRYVQFKSDKDWGVSAEAVSNRFLAGSERLSKSACSKLVELSWNRPGTKSPNFWKQIPPPIRTYELEELVSLMVRTLFEVFQVLSPTQLEIRRDMFAPKRIPTVEKARELFRDAGLPFPTIPEELAPRLKEIDKWHFATRRMKIYPYFLKDYVMGTGRYDRDYIVLAHAGHGENSYAIHYYVVYRYLRLFMQLAWGGWHMDNKKEAEKIRACFALADQLVEQAGAMKWDKRVGRMTIVVSDYDSRGSYWVPPPKAVEGKEGLFDVLGDALDCLRSAPNGPFF